MDLDLNRLEQDIQKLNKIEAKAASDEFLARLFGMDWLVPLRKGKHSQGRTKPANWKVKRDKKRRIAALSRARNARKGK